MNWNKAKLPLEILGVALLIVIAGWGVSKFGDKHGPLFVSADMPRKSTPEWDRMRSDAVATFTPKDKVWEDVRVTSETIGPLVEVETRPYTGANYFPITRSEAVLGETLSLGTSTLRLAAVGVGWRTQDEKEVPLRWFDPNFKTPIDASSIHPLGGVTDYPKCAFLFKAAGGMQLERDVLSVRIFDARTHQCLGGRRGYSVYSSHQAGTILETGLCLWHPAPVDVVVDVPDGPIKTVEFDPRVGEGFRDGNLDFRVMSVWDGMEENAGGSSGTTMQLRLRSKPGMSAWAFLVQPALPPGFTLMFLDEDGMVLDTNAMSTCDSQWVCLDMAVAVQKVAKIRVRYALAHRYVTLHLSELPGLPEENRGVKDLSAVRIPYVQFDSPETACRYVADLFQCSPAWGKVNPVPAPLVFKNVTVKEMVAMLEQKMDADIWVEGETLHCERHLTFKERMLEWYRKAAAWLGIK